MRADRNFCRSSTSGVLPLGRSALPRLASRRPLPLKEKDLSRTPTWHHALCDQDRVLATSVTDIKSQRIERERF